jgi:hypothetical protein
VLCGALTARVEDLGDEVAWRDFALAYYDHVAATCMRETGPFAGWDEIRFPAGRVRGELFERARTERGTEGAAQRPPPAFPEVGVRLCLIQPDGPNTRRATE